MGTTTSPRTINEIVMPQADEPDDDFNNLEASPIMSNITSERHVIQGKIIGINKLQLSERTSPRFNFIIEIKWNDSKISFISRDYDDFFRYHCWLLDTFKSEAGALNQPRIIPGLPGKKWFKNDMRLAEERLPLIETYINELMKIETICESYPAQAFFSARPGDPNETDEKLKLLFENMKIASNTGEKNVNVKGSYDNQTFVHD